MWRGGGGRVGVDSNRLNKPVIHTPTAACGCQKERGEKKICHYGRGEKISLSPNVPAAWFVFSMCLQKI